MRNLIVVFFLVMLNVCVVDAQVIMQDSCWVFAYFKNNGEDGLHMAYSLNGYSWKALKNDQSMLTPTAGKDRLMRDPNIIQGGDGKFHMVWTTGWKDRGIGYAASSDLIHWSEQRFVEVMAHEPDAQNCWAPEIFFDNVKGQYMIYWATTIPGRFPETDSLGDYNHRMYYSMTRDFQKFSEASVLYDQDFNVIDATIIKSGDRYVMFLKNETLTPLPEKNIRISYSKTLTSGYGYPTPPLTGKDWVEGPTVMKVDGVYIVYFDKYRDMRYGAMRSKDLKIWTDVSERIKLPEGIRHGSIIKISSRALENLMKVTGDKL